MSLYTFSTKSPVAPLKQIQGLHIEESTDITLLSQMGGITKGEVVERLANDNLAFVAFLNGQPAAFGWMANLAKVGVHNGHLSWPFKSFVLICNEIYH